MNLVPKYIVAYVCIQSDPYIWSEKVHLEVVNKYLNLKARADKPYSNWESYLVHKKCVLFELSADYETGVSFADPIAVGNWMELQSVAKRLVEEDNTYEEE